MRFDVMPVPIVHDSPNRRGSDAILLRKHALTDYSRHITLSDLRHFGRGQFRFSIVFAQRPDYWHHITAFIVTISVVFASRGFKQMLWIAARRVIARMANASGSRIAARGNREGDAVR